MRTVNRIGGAVLGLILLALGLAVAAGVALASAGRGGWVPLRRVGEAARTTTVGSPVVLWVSIALGVVGLVVLVLQLRPWSPQVVAAGRSGPTWLLSRRSVEHRVAAAAGGVSGVRRARARVRGRHDKWRLAVTAEGDEQARPALDRAVHSELARLGAAPAAESVRLRPRPT